jgi:hypothetical protein
MPTLPRAALIRPISAPWAGWYNSVQVTARAGMATTVGKKNTVRSQRQAGSGRFTQSANQKASSV